MGTSTKESSGIPQLKGDNFANWQFRVKLHLEAVEVSEALEKDAPAADPERKKFLQLDRKAKSAIVSFISDECLEIVREKETAKAMWKALEDTFAKKSVASQTVLRKQLARLRMREGSSMRSHFQIFDDLVRQLKTAGAKLEENDLVAQLFLTLPDSFDPLVTALENMNEDELTLEKVKQRLLAEEMKRSDRREDPIEEKGAAFVGGRNQKPKKFAGKCHRCGVVGHMQRDCQQKPKKSQGKANAACEAKAVSFMVNRSAPVKKSKEVVFYVDSGCSDHLVNSKQYLQSLRKLEEPFVVDVAKDGVSLVGEYEGEIRGYTKNGVRFEMKNVVYLPDLRGNLLSVKKLSESGIELLFTGQDGRGKAVIKHEGEVIAEAMLRGNLYELELIADSVTPTANLCAVEVSSIWHRRLGHASQHAMDTLVKHEMVTGIEGKLTNIGFCDTCVKGKQCRDPFNSCRERATRPLERVHSDVCGPIDPPAWDGSRYFVSFIDDFSHFAVIYTIKRKSQVFECFQEYEAMASSHWNLKISKLTVDQGTEYCSNEQRKFYKKKGIQIQPTVAYSPQQNGVAERFNRTLVEKIRSMLIDSRMPKNMWCEAALTATYLINRSPTTAIQEKVTPAECWTKSKPDLGKLRIFGCKAYAWVPNQMRKKLDEKSREAVMLGYAPNGYRLWDKSSRKVFIARDVRFDETCLPFAKNEVPFENDRLVIPIRYEQEGENQDAVHDVESDPEDEINDETDDEYEEVENPSDGEPHEATEAEPIETNPGALPSQTRREDCVESNTRRSERERKLPGKFLDFFTGFRATSASKISNSTDPPSSYAEIMDRDDRALWCAAVKDELKSLDDNQVWKLVRRPDGVKPLQSKWVFCTKNDENGNTIRHKARLVVKGYLQKPGLDFQETYAPVAKLTTIRTVLAVGVQKECHFHQMDVKTAFLHGELHEMIYMVVPDGVKSKPDEVCQLQKSLYGLKQSPRCWNEKFNSVMLKLGFRRSKHDYCLYVRLGKKKDETIFLVLYVDDLLIVGAKLEEIEALKQQLSCEFKMTDCGEVNHFLGMKIQYDQRCGRMLLSQHASIEKILNKFGMAECNPARSPMEKALQLKKNTSEPVQEPYQELLGSLMYCMMSTRPDICFSVGYLGRFQQQPGQQHWTSLKRVVRYLKGSQHMAMEFKRNDHAKPLTGFADADWAGDQEDRKSVSGFIFQVYGNTVAWSSKKQASVAMSSSEAEYIALSCAAAEAIWLTGILGDLGVEDVEPVTIFEDNHGCIGMAKNMESKRAKHIDIRYHFVRDYVAEGKLEVQPIGTKDQLADICTKALDSVQFAVLRKDLGLHDREGV